MGDKIRSARANALVGLVYFTFLFGIGMAIAGVTGTLLEQSHTTSPSSEQVASLRQ